MGANRARRIDRCNAFHFTYHEIRAMQIKIEPSPCGYLAAALSAIIVGIEQLLRTGMATAIG